MDLWNSVGGVLVSPERFDCLLGQPPLPIHCEVQEAPEAGSLRLITVAI